ncbi:MAG: mycofactocin biosynthesis peptidyl-dipeptidase MftE [Actinomycetota bacterium]
MRLSDMTSDDVRDVVRRQPDDGTLRPLVLVPIGSTEQHGPHLPLRTDTLIAEEIAGRAVSQTDGLVVGPSLAVTASGEHAGFAGTLSIGNDVLTQVIVELVRSADWAAGVVLVNAHGGNVVALKRAVDQLTGERRADGFRRRVLSWAPRWPTRADGGPPDLHAGRIETSLMLAIDPGLVRLELAVAGPDTPLDDLLPALRSNGVREVSPNGVLGDPAGASGAEGERFINQFVDHLVHTIERWRPVDPTPTD